MITKAHTLANLPKYPPLYICQEPSTNPPPFMQNKPNFLNTQRNVTSIIKKVYTNFHLLGRRQNKAKTNPIKPNFTNYFEPGNGFTRSEAQSPEPKCNNCF